jgi:predicted dehydrogenase
LPGGRTDALRDVMLHAVQDVARCVRRGGQPACGGEDGVAALALAEAIRAGARGA